MFTKFINPEEHRQQQPQCRCCLTKNITLVYHCIYADNELQTELSQCLPKSVNFEPSDGLTEFICDICRGCLRTLFDFQRRCEFADKELRRLKRASGNDSKLAKFNSMNNHQFNQIIDIEALDLKFVETMDDRKTDIEIMDPLHDFLLEESASTSMADEAIDELINKMLKDETTIIPTSTVPSPTSSTSTPFDHTHIRICAFTTDKVMPIHNDLMANNALQLTTATDQCRRPDEQEANFADAFTKYPLSNQCSPQQLTARSRNENETTVDQCEKKITDKHSCPKCEKEFTRSFQLKLHMISIHQLGDGMTYQCNDCDRTFASRHSLNYHKKSTHSSERPFSCSLCSRRFILRSQLVSHTQTHNGNRPRRFECSICHKMWPSKSDRKTHMRSHQKHLTERPFQCDLCNKSFFTRGHLYSHNLVHSGEKPFNCSLCNKAYQSIGNLKQHRLRRHPFFNDTSTS